MTWRVGAYNRLHKIKGASYWIPAPTNVGVYVFKNEHCLLVDTCLDGGQARQLDEVLKQHGLRPKYIINTHSHLDHCGGNPYVQTAYPERQVLAQEGSRLFLEHPELLAIILHSSNPFKDAQQKIQPFTANLLLDCGTNMINDEQGAEDEKTAAGILLSGYPYGSPATAGQTAGARCS